MVIRLAAAKITRLMETGRKSMECLCNRNAYQKSPGRDAARSVDYVVKFACCNDVLSKFGTMRHLLHLDNNKRIKLLHKAVCVFFLIGVAMSFPLWHGQRLFPVIPVLSGMPPLPAPWDFVLLGLFAGALLLHIFRINKVLTAVLLGLTALMVTLDQMRLQPWVFIYFLALLPLAFTDFRKEKSIEIYGPLWITYIRILLIGVYCWSGLHKFTPSFIDIVYPTLLNGLFKVPDGSWLLEVRELGYGAAAMELLIGLGLIFPKTRNLAVVGAVFSHVLIFAWISQ